MCHLSRLAWPSRCGQSPSPLSRPAKAQGLVWGPKSPQSAVAGFVCRRRWPGVREEQERGKSDFKTQRRTDRVGAPFGRPHSPSVTPLLSCPEEVGSKLRDTETGQNKFSPLRRGAGCAHSECPGFTYRRCGSVRVCACVCVPVSTHRAASGLVWSPRRRWGTNEHALRLRGGLLGKERDQRGLTAKPQPQRPLRTAGQGPEQQREKRGDQPEPNRAWSGDGTSQGSRRSHCGLPVRRDLPLLRGRR